MTLHTYIDIALVIASGWNIGRMIKPSPKRKRNIFARASWYAMRKTKGSNAAVFLIACIAYALTDIYGAARAIQLMHWAAIQLQKQTREVKTKWQSIKKVTK